METKELAKPRPKPCPSCPYRCDVPSGIWSADEYDKLPEYDGPTWSQPIGVFMCHQADGCVCSGWAGCHDMDENLAIRISLNHVNVEAIRNYTSPVPLFSSGAEAAEHGKRDIENPGSEAREKVSRLVEIRARRTQRKMS